ncbi:hypothetical protein [Demequina sp.]|uniref:hypothetical protein n=1 Tax=Demequina sp. TaxID=2050685 RepID=UPI003D0AC927
MSGRAAKRWVALLGTLLALSLGVGTAADATAGGTPTASVPTANAPVVKKVVGKGTPASCTETALFAAVRTGGSITFNCGPNPVTIKITKTLRTCNTHNCKHPWEGGKPLTAMTLDGGGKVTLSGGGKVGIYYANSCEESFGWLSSRCDKDATLQVTFKNLTFVSGNATKGVPDKESVGGGGGGGAIAMRGNKLTVVNSTFKSNVCVKAHSDAGGGAIRVVGVKSVKISGSTFSGNKCANGGAISSLGSPMSISTSTITGNAATGSGASSGKGGNGGGVYFDGASQNVTISSTKITKNKAGKGGGGSGVFYVSNNRGGTLTIKGSTVTGNTGEAFWTGSRHDLFYLGKKLSISSSTIS